MTPRTGPDVNAPEQTRTPMRAATQESGSGPVGAVGPVLAVLLLALGLLLLRDALVAAGALSGTPWLSGAADALEGFAPAWWLVPAGIAVALVGLWLASTAVRRRSRKTLPLTSRTGVFLHTRDIARLASGAAQDVDGVLDVSSTATRKRVSVTVHGTAEAGLEESVTDVVAQRLSALQSPPRVVVTVRTPKEN